MSHKIELDTSGMHCKACELYLENTLEKQKGVKKADAMFRKNIVELTLENDADLDEIRDKVQSIISKKGYSIGSKKQRTDLSPQIIFPSLIISILLVLIIYFADRSLSQVSINNNYGEFIRAFFIGVIASLSTCAAVTTALVLSMSTTQTNSKSGLKNIILFHISRLVSFAFFGGLLGIFGGLFINQNSNLFWLTTILRVFASALLIIIGLGLIFPRSFITRLNISLPKSFSKKILQKYQNYKLYPIILGVISFIVPCGFTLNLQIESVLSGDFFRGMGTMFTFAAGTLPVLAFISFLSFSISEFKYRNYLYPVAAITTMFIGIYQIYNLLMPFLF